MRRVQAAAEGFRQSISKRIGMSPAHQSIKLDAPEQALCARQPDQDGTLVYHSGRGSQYVSIRYTERLAEAGIEPSVGSKGDSYDNALAKTINGLYKPELIHCRARLGRLERPWSWRPWSGRHGSTTIG
jgi:transposase InsO family protein